MKSGRRQRDRLSSLLETFERVVVWALVGLMTLVVTLAIVELAWILIRDVVTPPVLLLEVDELLELFGLFLLVLIGLELLETIKAYLSHRVVYVEIILKVAVIALARKVIVLDFARYPGTVVLGLAALVIALAVAFSLLKLGDKRRTAASDRAPSTGRSRALADRRAAAPQPHTK